MFKTNISESKLPVDVNKDGEYGYHMGGVDVIDGSLTLITLYFLLVWYSNVILF